MSRVAIEALKCDRCRQTDQFDDSAASVSPRGKWSVMRFDSSGSGPRQFAMGEPNDLCPSCTIELSEWIRTGGTDRSDTSERIRVTGKQVGFIEEEK